MVRESLERCDSAMTPTQLGILEYIGKTSDGIGERCYLVGGAVRDCLLGKENKDLDFVCSDSEKIVDALAKKVAEDTGREPTVAKFKKYGTFQIHMHGEDLEFVNPRKETYTYQSIKPEVSKGSFVDDAFRRDFTLNTLFLGIQPDDWMEVVDLTEKGIEDLKAGILKTPLDPDTTFQDDPSRLFRLARFKACKGFSIDPDTRESARRNAHEVNEIVEVNGLRERVPRDSVKQMMDKGIVCDGYLETLDDIGVLEEVIPEVEPMKDCGQPSEHHLYDVWAHTLRVIDNLPKDRTLRWSGLFHDMGKPVVMDRQGTFHRHAAESEKIAHEVMARLKFSNSDVRRISHIVRYHMSVLNLLSQDDPRRGKSLTDSAIRRFTVLNDGYESDLIEFAYADTKAAGAHWKSDHKRLERFEDRLRDMQYDLGMVGGDEFRLEVDGNDVMRILGLSPSPEVGRVLSGLTDAVVDGRLKNDRAELLEYLYTLSADK